MSFCEGLNNLIISFMGEGETLPQWQIDAQKQSLVTEKSGLDIKVYNLNEYLVSDKFEELDGDSQDLLIKQINAMEEYQHILEVRIQKF